MRFLFSGGASGGHVNPALAIAEIMKANYPGCEIAFVGTPDGIENSLVPQAGYKLYKIKIEGVNGKSGFNKLKAYAHAFTSQFAAKKVVKEFKPDIVIGTGGYACWPALKAATEMGIPTMLHESNSFPGMAVRKLQNDVDVIMTNFESTKDLLSENACVVNVGNPVRRDCAVLTRSDARAKLGIDDEKFVVLSFGGSLGAECLNNVAVDYMKNFTACREDVIAYHVGGRNYYEDAKKKLTENKLLENERNVLISFTSDLPVYMAAADVVICRAGAMTITELARMGKVAIIIPSVNVTDNHQYKNAKSLADAGAAILLEESDIANGKSVSALLEELYSNKSMCNDMSEKVRVFAQEDVEKVIFEAVKNLLESYKKIVK
ncbi:MAG: undecaprenyldiphospho-muramoylpentapeptide beta-N-acetylglucosaminyltransferase [Ruminococcaceae bacterium]|nr:undecaprenyldiphospho-muramoylpentapeptide beta-N-acetylglucosaminyltransferase [Oscillospiraceae bacterium]